MAGVSSNDLLVRAVAAHQAGDLAAAAAGYRDVLARSPGHADAMHYLGMIAYQQGRIGEARTRVGEAAQAQPRNPAILANLGLVLFAADRLEEAAQTLSAALELGPRQSEAWHTFGLVRQRQGQVRSAIDCQRQTLALAPGHRAARLSLASLLISDGSEALAAEILREGCELSGITGVGRSTFDAGVIGSAPRAGDQAHPLTAIRQPASEVRADRAGPDDDVLDVGLLTVGHVLLLSAI